MKTLFVFSLIVMSPILTLASKKSLSDQDINLISEDTEDTTVQAKIRKPNHDDTPYPQDELEKYSPENFKTDTKE